MAINDTQKVDWLWKKVGYGTSKTDVNSIKNATNESIASPLLLRGDNLWTDAASIPSTKPSASNSYVEIYDDSGNGTATIQCLPDNTASPNRTWKTNLTDWIPTEFGSTYLVKVYVDSTGSSTPESTGTQLFASGSGNNDEWFFDYQSGLLNFIGDNLPSGIVGNAIYIIGARYVGNKGTNFSSLNSDTANLGNFFFSVNTMSTTNVNGDIILDPNGTGRIILSADTKIDSTGAITIPVGDISERPTSLEQGMIRYNTTDSTFEGYDGINWGSLGGVKDVDQDTYILAESSAGTDNDQLDFYTAGTQALQIDSTGDFKFGDSLDKFVIDWATGNTNIAGNLDVTGNVDVAGNITLVGNITIGGNTTGGDADTDTISFAADIISNILPDVSDTYDLGATGKSWRDIYLNDDLVFEDASGGSKIVIPNNQGDALSFVTSTGIDLIVFDTTTSNSFVSIATDEIFLSETTITSASVTDLTDDQIVIAGTSGALEGDANLTFNSTQLAVGVTNFTVQQSSGNVYTAGTLETDGQATLSTAVIENLTSDRIVVSGGAGLLEDDANFTFNGTQLAIGVTNFTVQQSSGNTQIVGTLDVDSQTTLASAIVEDLTSGRVVLAGLNGELEDNSNLTFDGSQLTVTGDVDVTANLDVDGQATLASVNVEDISDNHIVIAGTAGELEGDSNFTFNGTQLAVGVTNFTLQQSSGNLYTAGTLETDGQATFASANIEDLTTGRIVLSGTSGEIEDSVNLTFDNTDFNIGQGKFTANVVTGDVYAEGDVTVNGDLLVNGNTTTVNSNTVTIDDPIFTLGGDTAPTINDSLDKGIEFRWHDGTNAKLGFFGYDESISKFTFIPDATNTNEVFSGTSGDAVFGDLDLSSATVNNIQIGISASTEIDTTVGNLILDSVGGTVEIDDNATIAGTLSVTGETTLASAIVSDLTDNQIVIAGTAGALEGDANLTFNGTTLTLLANQDVTGTVNVTGQFNIDNIRIDNNAITSTNTDGDIILTPVGTGQVIISTAVVSDLTDNRIVIAGNIGTLEDNANLTYDGTDLSTNSLIVTDLTDNRIMIAGASGAVEDDSNFTFDGTTLTLVAAANITGVLDVDNININGNTVSSTDANGNINITPNGTGEVVIGPAVISTASVTDLTDDRIVIAGTSGELEDDANFRFDGTNFQIGASGSETFIVNVSSGNTTTTGTFSSGTLSDNRVVIAGTGGILEDDANFTFNGTSLNVGTGNFTVESASGDTNVNGDLTVGEAISVGSAIGSTSTTTGAITVVGGAGVGENLYVGGNVAIGGTLGADGGITLGDDAATDVLTLNASVTNNITPTTNDTYSLGETGTAWKDLFLSESIAFQGSTSDNEIVIPTNLSDALSITETSGDLIVFKTTSGDRKITLYPNTIFEGNLTLGTSVGTTTVQEILDEDNMASDSATALATQQSIKAYVDTVEANVEIEFQGTTGTQGSVNLRTEVFDILGTTNEIETTSSGTQLTIGLPNDITISNDLIVTNDLTVNGDTATFNVDTLAIEDSIITIAGTSTPSANDSLDKGIEFHWHTGSAAKLGFFGYDESTSTFTFIPDATNTNELISGAAGNVAFGDGTFTNVTAGNIKLAVTDDNTIDTTSGNLTISTVGGTVTVDDNLTVTSEATLSSAIVEDLTDNRIVIVGSNSELEDNSNFRFDGTTFMVGAISSEVFDVAVATGNTNIQGTLNVQGDADFGGTVTLGGSVSDNIITTGLFASNLIPDNTDTRDLGSSTNGWRDLYLTESINFTGATGENEIVVPANLADTLSVKDSVGDLIVITTTTGSRLITLSPAVELATSLKIGNTQLISSILDEDNMASDSNTALATQQSIKAYVDSENNAQALSFAGDSGVGSVTLFNQTFSISGTTNEITTSGLNQQITIGLPDDVTITNDLTVSGDTTITGDLTVNGTTTTVNTTELVVTDNIITLNDGEAGAGVTAGSAGIEIDRGTAANKSWIWDESTDRWSAGTEDIQAGQFYGTIDGGTF